MYLCTRPHRLYLEGSFIAYRGNWSKTFETQCIWKTFFEGRSLVNTPLCQGSWGQNKFFGPDLEGICRWPMGGGFGCFGGPGAQAPRLQTLFWLRCKRVQRVQMPELLQQFIKLRYKVFPFMWTKDACAMTRFARIFSGVFVSVQWTWYQSKFKTCSIVYVNIYLSSVIVHFGATYTMFKKQKKGQI